MLRATGAAPNRRVLTPLPQRLGLRVAPTLLGAVALLAAGACVQVYMAPPAPAATPERTAPVSAWLAACVGSLPWPPGFYQVEQQSMEKTLLPHDFLVLDVAQAPDRTLQRGDIVVFTPPGGSASSTPFIKRVIGLPGDVLDLRNGHVFINGQEISEPYVDPDQTTEPLGGGSHWVVPLGSLFVMGDHRENSTDSRVFGPVPIANVIGRAVYRCAPTSRSGVLAVPTYPDLSPLTPSASSAR